MSTDKFDDVALWVRDEFERIDSLRRDLDGGRFRFQMEPMKVRELVDRAKEHWTGYVPNALRGDQLLHEAVVESARRSELFFGRITSDDDMVDACSYVMSHLDGTPTRERPCEAWCIAPHGHPGDCTLPESLRAEPTLAEWMGEEWANLPEKWRAVLREQPVPAGCIDTWTWRMSSGGEWRLHGRGTRSGTAIVGLAPVEVVRVINGDDDPWLDVDTAQMAFFTRHPSVKPTPRPVQCWQPHDGDGAL